MKEAKLRKILRWMHIILGLVIMCYIYSPFHQNVLFQIIMKFIIIPVITISGIWIWQFKSVNKFLNKKADNR